MKMKVDDLFNNVFEDFQELQQESNGIDNTRVWQIQWSITEEDESSNRPQFIFARNKNEAMMKLSNRLNLFDSNIQIESVKEIDWGDVEMKFNEIRKTAPKRLKKLAKSGKKYELKDVYPWADDEELEKIRAVGKKGKAVEEESKKKKSKGFYSGAWNKAEKHTKYDPPKTGNKGKSARRGFVG